MQPTLRTEHLVLRPFALGDAPAIKRLAGEYAIADTTLTIPHPYTDGVAETWIATHPGKFARDEVVAFAITVGGAELAGAISLEIDRAHQRAELGYWIGVPFWGRGYATEAAAATIRYGFDALGLNRIFARHLTRNPASGSVMKKVGMTYEGCLRQHTMKWGRFEDVACYAILRDER